MKFDRTNIEHLSKWNIRRIQIMHRDKYKCVKCGSGQQLQVHHIKYWDKLEYWEYSDEYLETLCKLCHMKEHNTKPLDSFYSKVRIKKYTGITKLYKEILN
jgi:5-methylcytosine-specific restriction endonuclease McrA